MLYLAYGSNISSKQMSQRCPSTLGQVPTLGLLDDYKLVFDGFSAGRKGLVANIVPNVGSKVPYVLWDIQENEVKQLDLYEGHSKHYRRQTIRVQGKNVLVYIMTDHKKSLRKPEHVVSEEYYEVIQTGYKEFGIDENYLKVALESSKQLN